MSQRLAQMDFIILFIVWSKAIDVFKLEKNLIMNRFSLANVLISLSIDFQRISWLSRLSASEIVSRCSGQLVWCRTPAFGMYEYHTRWTTGYSQYVFVHSKWSFKFIIITLRPELRYFIFIHVALNPCNLYCVIESVTQGRSEADQGLWYCG